MVEMYVCTLKKLRNGRSVPEETMKHEKDTLSVRDLKPSVREHKLAQSAR